MLESGSPWMIIIQIAYIGTSWIVYLCSIKEVYQVRKQAKSTYYSPLPYLVMFFSCLSWCIWSTLKQDYVNFASYAIGAWASVWYMTSVFPLSEYKLLTEIVAVIGTCAYSVFLFLLLGYLPLDTAVTWLGHVSVGITISLFGSPIIQMIRVIRVRDSSTMPIAFILTASFSTILWAFYGWLTDALPIIIVNSTTSTINWMQLIVSIAFHPKWRNIFASLRWRWIRHYLGLPASRKKSCKDSRGKKGIEKEENGSDRNDGNEDKESTFFEEKNNTNDNGNNNNNNSITQELKQKNESEDQFRSKNNKINVDLNNNNNNNNSVHENINNNNHNNNNMDVMEEDATPQVQVDYDDNVAQPIDPLKNASICIFSPQMIHHL